MKTQSEQGHHGASSSSEFGLEMMRMDLQESPIPADLDPKSLPCLQQILLTTDGTVTDILEAYVREMVGIVKLDHKHIVTTMDVPFLRAQSGTDAILRKVILRGEVSHKNYIYAESILIPSRLSEAMRDTLQNTSKPIGRLMLETKMETFREILSCRREKMGSISEYYGLSPDSNVISRTYRVMANKQPIVLITEKFPETYFVD